MSVRPGLPSSYDEDLAREPEHEHWFPALWSHLGPHGRQDIHYHPCTEDECPAALVGYGRECNGPGEPHLQADLPLPDDLVVPGEPARLVAPEPVTADARWQALKDYLDEAIARWENQPPVPGDDATTIARACHLSADRSLRSKMTELEASDG